ncbi:ParB N-terminal domain-containing protein [Bauldia litoralis]|uniref:ParB N-terminal domain-containing protein n=1 Tax=Bauldia litoralis TaxID=665467 RepID=UPI0032665C3B
MREPKPDLANGYAVSRDLNPTLVSVSSLSPLGRATRKHPAKQINKLAASLKEFGFALPIVADKNGGVVAGWALVQAAKKLNFSQSSGRDNHRFVGSPASGPAENTGR